MRDARKWEQEIKNRFCLMDYDVQRKVLDDIIKPSQGEARLCRLRNDVCPRTGAPRSLICVPWLGGAKFLSA